MKSSAESEAEEDKKQHRLWDSNNHHYRYIHSLKKHLNMRVFYVYMCGEAWKIHTTCTAINK